MEDGNCIPQDRDLLALVQRMIDLRRRHPVFRRGRFFQGLEPRQHL